MVESEHGIKKEEKLEFLDPDYYQIYLSYLHSILVLLHTEAVVLLDSYISTGAVVVEDLDLVVVAVAVVEVVVEQNIQVVESDHGAEEDCDQDLDMIFSFDFGDLVFSGSLFGKSVENN